MSIAEPTPTIEHGTLVGYSRGCRDACCRRARRLHETQRRRDRDQGIVYLVDALGTRRRIQALMRLGWRAEDIAGHCGWRSSQSVQLLANNRDKVNRKTAAHVADIYERLSMKLGPSKQTRARAERAGWPPPLAWDDIDDPAEQPGAETSELGAWSQFNADRAEDLEFLADCGESLTEAMRRLDITDRDALWKWCDRHGLRDVYGRLARRERIKENGYTTQGGAA